MKFRVRLHELFLSDVEAFAEWLDAAAPGMGAEFAALVDRALDGLEERPLSYAVGFDAFRRVLIPRYNAVVPFLVEGHTVYVAGIVHGSRDLTA